MDRQTFDALKAQRPGKVLLFREASTWRLYYEDAEAAAPILRVSLVTQTAGPSPLVIFANSRLEDLTRVLVMAGLQAELVGAEPDPLSRACRKCRVPAGAKCKNYLGRNKQTCPGRGKEPEQTRKETPVETDPEKSLFDFQTRKGVPS